jgi:hypothetical protein
MFVLTQFGFGPFGQEFIKIVGTNRRSQAQHGWALGMAAPNCFGFLGRRRLNRWAS